MKNAMLWAVLGSVLCLLAVTGRSAPIVEINSNQVQLALPPYVDVLEDREGNLSIADVASERYAFQFSPASMGELFFGYTRSVYWLRFTVENQRDKDLRLLLEVLPPDVDYLDLYTVNPQTGQVRGHRRLGSAVPYNDRVYDVIPYLFDIDVEAHSINTYFLRAASDKTINVELSLNSMPEYLRLQANRMGWQGFLTGALLVVGILQLGLYALFSYRGFLWYGLFLLSVFFIQLAWNGFLLPFFEQDSRLLDREILPPIFLAIFFSTLFAQTLLRTRRRVRWQHLTLNGMAVFALLGVVMTWLLPPHLTAMGASMLALVSIVFIFSVTLHANMEGMLPARHFLLARTFTTSIVLISIFNVHGYLPQGSFTSWGIACAVLLESVVMALSMVSSRLLHLKETYAQVTGQDGAHRQEHSLVNLSDICHELRTPISGVLGMADLLMNGTLTDQQRNQIRTIHRSGQALLEVTNKLSDLSSIERGTVELNQAPFELTPLIEACVENCRARAEFNNIELIYHIDTGVTGFVKGDQDKLQQVIVNLLQFALRHMEQGEVVLGVQAGNPEQTAFTIRSGHNTLVERNLAPGDRQLGSSDHLNLTIAEQYTRLMGGELLVQSYIDGGVSIHFAICLDPHEHPSALDQEDNLILHGRRLLIVDDNATCCSIIEQQAVQWGMSAVSAHGGKEALAILRSRTTVDEPFDIVLMDYDMPGMNGLELATHIHDDPNINSEKVLLIMLTGVSKGPNRITSEGATIHCVLYKPLSGKSLKYALQAAMAQHVGRASHR